jgi:uncharacterized protein YkwD
LLLPACLLIAAACGVPTSAADQDATPEPTTVNVSQTTITSRLAEIASETVQRSLELSAIATLTTTPPTVTPTIAATLAPPPPKPTNTPTPIATLTPTLTPFGTPPATPTATFTPSPTPSVDTLVSEALAILNKYRTDSGRAALRVDAALAASALAYARQIAETGRFSHTGPDGSSPGGRAARAGYAGGSAGISEALAGGQGTAQEAVSAWLNSPAHAAIALDPAAVYAGIGYARSSDTYGHYWVLVTGK